jgi:plasmid maintenance system antidote protein VapI
MTLERGSGWVGLCDLVGLDRFVVLRDWHEGGADLPEAHGFFGGEPRALGYGAAAPNLDPLSDVAARPLLAPEIPGQRGWDDPELLGGLGLRKTWLSLEEAGEEIGGEALGHSLEFRFMNQFREPVKTEVAIHDREPCRVERMAGRTPDDSVAWYCHMRASAMLGEGKTQKKLAELAGVPKSAVNHLVKHAKGVGPSTAAGFARAFGFQTRGGLVDAADVWWEREGRTYALAEMRAMARERQAKATKPARSGNDYSAADSGKKTG